MLQPESTSTKSSHFAIDVAKLVTGTTIANVITILASPILTRLYGPAAFGFFALFMSITGIIVTIACMRYELAIMLPKNDEEAVNLLVLSLSSVAIISLLTIPALYFGGDVILKLLGAPGLAPYLWFIPPFVFMSGIFLALRMWNLRTCHFTQLSVAQITNSAATTSTQVGAGLFGYATGGSLIGATLVGSFISLGYLGGQTWREDHAIIQKGFSIQGMISGMKRYRKFPMIDSGSALLNSISWQLPAFLLSAFFSPIIVGFYALGYRVLQLPMSFIGGALSQVFFQRATEAKIEGTLDKLVENVFRILVQIGLFPTLLITFIGGDLFAIIFGEIWREAGIYAQILSIWTIVLFISSPLTGLLAVLEKLQFGLKWNIVNFFTRLFSIVIGGLMGSVYIALGLFAVSGILVYGYLCISIMRFSRVSWSAMSKIVLSNILIFIPVGITLSVLIILNLNSLTVVIVAFVAALVYYVYLIKTDSQFRVVLYQFGLMK
jgi:O-antigen/teichoic acid export membrane protein